MTISTRECRRDPLVQDWATASSLRDELLHSRPSLGRRVGGYDGLAMVWIAQPDGTRVVAARATCAGSVRWIVDAISLPCPRFGFTSVADMARAMLALADGAKVTG